MLNDKRIKDYLSVTAEKKIIIIKCLQITCSTLLQEIDRTFISAFNRHAPILTPSDITINVHKKMGLAQLAILRTPPPRRRGD